MVLCRRRVRALPGFLSLRGLDVGRQKETTWDNFDLKVTAQLAQNHRLNVTASLHEYLGPSAGDIFSEPSAWSENWNEDRMLALDYSAILGQNTVLEARAGTWRGDNEYRSQYPSGEPFFVDQVNYPWLYYGDVWWQWEWEQHSDNAEVIITQHADDFIKGDHEFRFGVQYERGGGTTKTFNPDYYYQRLEYVVLPGLPHTSTSTGTRGSPITTVANQSPSAPLSPTAGP